MQRGGLRRGLGKELVASPAAGFRKPLLAARHKSRPPPRHARACRGCPGPGRHRRWHHHPRRPQPGQPAAAASGGSAAVSRRSWLPAPCAKQLLTGAWHAARRPRSPAHRTAARGRKGRLECLSISIFFQCLKHSDSAYSRFSHDCCH